MLHYLCNMYSVFYVCLVYTFWCVEKLHYQMRMYILSIKNYSLYIYVVTYMLQLYYKIIRMR